MLLSVLRMVCVKNFYCSCRITVSYITLSCFILLTNASEFVRKVSFVSNCNACIIIYLQFLLIYGLYGNSLKDEYFRTRLRFSDYQNILFKIIFQGGKCRSLAIRFSFLSYVFVRILIFAEVYSMFTLYSVMRLNKR